MEDILRAIVLGIIQGLTEFLPISSSGHLILTRELFGWEFSDDLTFDVALHLGTTAAVLTFFWAEWMQMLRAASARFLPRVVTPALESDFYWRLLLILIVGSIPTAVAGLLFDNLIEEKVRSPFVVGAMLIIFGVILYAAERVGRRERNMASMGFADALKIGLAQTISLIPGVSRSGATISAGLFGGLTRDEIARFSFLLATPAILGAGLLKLSEAVADGIPAEDIAVITAGAAVSALVGWIAIGFLLRVIQTRSFLPFIVYRLAAGIFVLIFFSARALS